MIQYHGYGRENCLYHESNIVFKIGCWDLDAHKWKTDVYLIKMRLSNAVKMENEIKDYYENRVKQMDECVREEISRTNHGQKYRYTKTDYSDFSYANFCDKDRENMDCCDFLNGTDLFTGNQTSEILSIRRKLYLKRLNIRRMKDEKGVYKNILIFFLVRSLRFKGCRMWKNYQKLL